MPIDRDRSHPAGRERGQVAAKDIGRGAERAAMQQDRRHAAAILEIADVESIDRDETIIGSDHDVHHRLMLLLNGRQCAAMARA